MKNGEICTLVEAIEVQMDMFHMRTFIGDHHTCVVCDPTVGDVVPRCLFSCPIRTLQIWSGSIASRNSVGGVPVA